MASRNPGEIGDLRRRFAENLIALRSKAGVSQLRAAERSGLHHTEVSLLERGLRLPRLDTVVKLAGAVEAEPGELLAGMRWRLADSAGRAGTYALQEEAAGLGETEPSR